MSIFRKFTWLATLAIVGASLLLPGAAQASQTVTLTNASNGTSVTLVRGDQLVVLLTGSAGAGTQSIWSLPATSTTGVLAPQFETQLGIYTVALYNVSGYGATTVTSEEACRITSPGHACPLFVLLWRAGVTVPVVDPPPPAA